MGVANKNGELIVLVQHAHCAGLFLRKQQTAFFGSNNSVCVVGSLPDELPFRASCGDTGNGRNRRFFSRSRLRKIALPARVSLLSNSNRTEGQRKSQQ